jgi:hypothetical protein
MTLQAVLQFVGIIPNGAGDSFSNTIVSQLTSIYENSSTMRSALDARVSSGLPLSFEFVPGAMRNVRTMQGNSPVSDVVQFDPVFSDTFLSINQFGDVH